MGTLADRNLSNNCCACYALVDASKARHSANLRKGRVMLFCFGSEKGHALGNYFLPLATATLASLLLDLAIVIQCDDPPRRGEHREGVSASGTRASHVQPQYRWHGETCRSRSAAT